MLVCSNFKALLLWMLSSLFFTLKRESNFTVAETVFHIINIENIHRRFWFIKWTQCNHMLTLSMSFQQCSNSIVSVCLSVYPLVYFSKQLNGIFSITFYRYAFSYVTYARGGLFWTGWGGRWYFSPEAISRARLEVPIIIFTIKENHVGSAVIETLLNRHKDKYTSCFF